MYPERMFPGFVFAAMLLLSTCAKDSSPGEGTPGIDDRKPNFLLIVADDMAYSDLGSFGGEIDTPNLDQLALNGMRLTNFHSAPMCSPSRAMLLTGVDSHLAGFGNMLEELSPNQKGQPGYEGYLGERVITVATLLSDAGYQTYLSGKWHLGSGDNGGPSVRGFHRSFSLASGGASHFSDMRPAYASSPEVKADYWEDGVKLTALPDRFEYSSQFYVDRLIENLRESEGSEQPFFAYLSFTAPHWPLQAPDGAIARQAGRYDEGYDVLADRRLERSRKLGVILPDAGRSGRSPKEVPWSQLNDMQRKVEIRMMEVYAAMVSEMDKHTGRLLNYLKSSGRMENTVVIFLSDNGAEGHDLDETWPADVFPEIRRTINSTHDFSFENIGRPGSYTLYGPNWANAGAPSFRLHKGFPTEGGTHVTAFVHFPPIIKAPVIVNDFVFIKDITPTILDLAGVEHPGDSYSGKPIESMTGISFLPLLRGEEQERKDRVTGIELLGKRAVRSGDWKLVFMPEPYGIDDWQLFNLLDDISESQDISAEHPEIVAELKERWEVYATENKVIIPDWVSGY